MVRNELEPYESRGSRTVLRGGGRRKASSLPDHPADSAAPSGVDEETFERVFGNCDWAVMAILARGGETYARLRFNVGPAGTLLVPVEVDFSEPFPAADPDVWEKEYEQHVTSAESRMTWADEALGLDVEFDAFDAYDLPVDEFDETEEMAS